MGWVGGGGKTDAQRGDRAKDDRTEEGETRERKSGKQSRFIY